MNDNPLPEGSPTIIDHIVPVFLEKMQYRPGERDLIVLHHIFEVELEGKTRTITSTLIDFGIPNGNSAMARTVSLPAAIGVKHILLGTIDLKGVLIPVQPEVYNPVLDELATMGINCEEKMLD